MLTDTFIIGAGGHGKIVYDAFCRVHPDVNVQVWDDNPELSGKVFLDKEILAPVVAEKLPATGHIAIGDGVVRERWSDFLTNNSRRLISVLHSDAIISKWSVFEDGCFIAAGAVLGPNVSLGKGVIVNHCAVVDHDCIIGAYTHIAPNSTLGGGVNIGKRCLVGAGAVLLPGIKLGDDIIVGAGSVVVKDIPSGDIVYGVPAKCPNG